MCSLEASASHCGVRCSKPTNADPRIQTWLVPRSPALSFVLLHAGSCSSHLSLWPGSSALEEFYFFNGGKSQSYIELKIPVMDAGLPESPTWSVVLPVMVPASFAVCSKAIHIHLGGKGECYGWKAIAFHLKCWRNSLFSVYLQAAAPEVLRGIPRSSAAWQDHRERAQGLPRACDILSMWHPKHVTQREKESSIH